LRAGVRRVLIDNEVERAPRRFDVTRPEGKLGGEDERIGPARVGRIRRREVGEAPLCAASAAV
jgi:hypothetical protein